VVRFFETLGSVAYPAYLVSEALFSAAYRRAYFLFDGKKKVTPVNGGTQRFKKNPTHRARNLLQMAA
jgi:hypothetical protein